MRSLHETSKMLRIKKVRYIYIKELLSALYGHFLHLPVHLHDAISVEICRRNGGKGIGDERSCSVFLLFGADAGTGFIAFGYLVGGPHYFWEILENALSCLL